MVEEILNGIQGWLGLGKELKEVSALQMGLRTVVVYAFTLGIIRLGSKRFLSKATAFDVIVGIMLGSIMSSAVNGSAPFLQTLLVGSVLVALHWMMAALAFRFDWFGTLVKGEPVLLIEDGEIQESGMRAARLSDHDLKQALRMQNSHTDPKKIRRAYLERSGSISVLPFEGEPRVLDVKVADGVQTVRIEI